MNNINTEQQNRDMTTTIVSSTNMGDIPEANSANNHHDISINVDINRLHPSTYNPRKSFNEVKLAELANSIKIKGVLEPLLVREHVDMNNSPYLEIVAGERRYRAAKMAGLSEVPVIIRNLTDEEAKDLALIENIQREDLTPLEQAEAYAAYTKKYGYTAAEIAAGVGKNKSHIYQRMKLVDLPASMKKALNQGAVLLEVALLVARIYDKDQREKCAEYVLNLPSYDGPVSEKRVRDIISREYMTDLRHAPFKLNDDTLYPTAGPCTTCLHRTGNNADLFGETKSKDVCTNTPCYQEKIKLTTAKKIEEAKAKGLKILDPNEAKKVFSWGTLKFDSGYIDLGETNHNVNKKYGQLLKKQGIEVIIGIDDRGVVHELTPRKEAEKKLVEMGVIKIAETRIQKSEQDKDRERTLKARKNALRTVVQKLATAAKATAPIFSTPKQKDLIVLVAKAITANVRDDTAKPLCSVLNLNKEKGASNAMALADYIGGLSPEDAFTVMVQVAFLSSVGYPYTSHWSLGKLEEHASVILDCLEIDIKKIEHEAKTAIKEHSDTTQTKAKLHGKKKKGKEEEMSDQY